MSETQNNQKKPSTVKCPVCGAEVSTRRIYCPECGVNVKSGAPRSTAPASRQSKQQAQPAPRTPADASEQTPPQAEREQAQPPEQARAPEQAEHEQARAPEQTEHEQVRAPEQAAQEKTDASDVQPQATERQSAPEMDYFSVKPNGEPFDFPLPPVTDGGGKCGKCGAPVSAGSKYCGSCGAALESKCARCGSVLAPNARFCRVCGAPQAQASAAPVPQTLSVEQARKRGVKLAAVLWLAIGLIVGVAFSLMDFLTVYVRSADGTRVSLGQDGLALFGVMFGGRSSLTALGVPIELLRFAGWLYLAGLLVGFAAIVCIVINTVKNKPAAPIGILATSAVYLAIGTAILALSIVAKQSIDTDLIADDAKLSFFMGGIGIFVGSAISFVGSLAVFFISRKLFKDKPPKKLRIGYYAGLGAVCAFIAVFACVPALVEYSSNRVSPNGSGRATVFVSESLDDGYYGAEVVKLEDLEYGSDYEFSIRTDDYIASEFMEDCLILCYADEVEGKGTMDIILFATYLEINQTSAVSTAKLIFTAEYSRDVAVVVCFAADNSTSLRFSYSLTPIS